MSFSPGSAARRASKYRNERTTVDGVTYASKREANRAQQLKNLERSRTISDLKFQQRFRIEVNGVHVCDYIADSTYRDGGVFVVEDVKSPSTRKNRAYILKRKLMKACFGIDILEV